MRRNKISRKVLPKMEKSYKKREKIEKCENAGTFENGAVGKKEWWQEWLIEQRKKNNEKNWEKKLATA